MHIYIYIYKYIYIYIARVAKYSKQSKFPFQGCFYIFQQ